MSKSISGMHDPYEDQLAAARYRAERDALAQAVQRVADSMRDHALGVEGMEDSPVSGWERELRAALGGMENIGTTIEYRRVLNGVCKRLGLTDGAGGGERVMDERNALPRVLNHKRGRTTYTGADQNLWFVEMPDGTIVCCSHVSFAVDTGMPECMAFPAERNGDGYRVTDWGEMAVSYSSDPEEAFREVLDALMQMYEEGE